MTKVISYANVQIKYNADTTGLKAHRTDLAAMTRLLRSGETEGEKFVRRIEMISRMSASNKKTQEEVAAATKVAADQLLAAARSSGRYLEALRLIETVAPNAAVNTRQLADAFKAEQQAAKDAADAAAAKKRLMADYAMDTVAAKREVKARQQIEKDAADAQIRNAKLDARLAEEKRQRMAQANALSKKLDSDDAASRQARLTGQQQMQQQADAYLQMLEEEAQKNREMLSMEELGIQLARQRNSEERERVRLLRQQKKDKEAFRQIESSQRMGHPQSVADFSVKLRKLISDTERQEEIARNKEQQQFHSQRMARSKEFEAEVIRAANSQTKKYAAAQKEVNAIIQQGMTIEERRIQTLRRLDAMVQRRIITEKQHKQAIDAVNRSSARDSATKDLGMGALSGLTPMGGFTAGAVGAFAAQQTLQFAKDSVMAYAEMRGELVKLEVMLGSVEQAERSYAEFRGIAVKASLESKAVTAAALTLAQFGVATERLAPTMRQLSVMAAGNSERLQSLALAFAQTTAAGRLTGQETLQFVNSGFSPLAEIARVTGVEMSVLRKRMEEGKISVQDVANSLITATEAGGRFYGMAEKLANDLPGQIAALRDEFQKLQQVTGEFFVESGGSGLMVVLKQVLREARETMQLASAVRDDFLEFALYGNMNNDATIMNIATTYADITATITKESNDAAASAEKAAKAQKELKKSMGVAGPSNFFEMIVEQATSFSSAGEKIWEGLDKAREQVEDDLKTVRSATKPQQMTTAMISSVADRLAFLVENFGLSQQDAAKYLADAMKEDRKTSSELPKRIALGTKEAYEMSVKAQNDIQFKQLQKQDEQIREQKATNEILRRLNLPQMGMMN